MSEIDKDLQRRLKGFADVISPQPGWAAVVVRKARTKRRLVAMGAGLAMLVAIGGLAGETTLLGHQGGIKPAPGPEETNCVSAGYDLTVFVPEEDFHDKMVELNDRLIQDNAVASFEFVSAADALQEYLRENPNSSAPPPTFARRSQYRVVVKAEVDPDGVARRLADLGDGAHVPALDCPPKEPEKDFARYFFQAAKADSSASGVLEVNAADASICLDVRTRNIKASHLLWTDPVGPGAGGMVVLTFFDPNDGEEGTNLPPSGRHCLAGAQLGTFDDDGLLARLLDSPDEFKLDFHRGPNDEPGLIAELTSLAEAETAEMGCLSQDDDSYGATAIGQWLTEVLTRLGAPKQAHLTSADIMDTGTSLGLSADVYGSRLWAYITAQRPPDDRFPPRGAEIVGEHREFVLYYWQDRTIKSFTAHSPEWQLSVSVYPTAGEQEVPWTRDDSQLWSWFRRVLDDAAENPPPCS